MKNRKETYILLGQEVSADEFINFKKTLKISSAFADVDLGDGAMEMYVAKDAKGKKYTYCTGVRGNQVIHEIDSYKK